MMSRKNLLASLTERKLTAVNLVQESENIPNLSPSMERNRNRGAFGAITRSIDELAEKAQAAKDFETKLLEGETVFDLDPEDIDGSFIADRMGADEDAFNELVEAIRQRGQDSPILVRPHPEQDGRYMIVFGHRRARAAMALGRPVRAVVKNLNDRDHVIAQGQENSARADLSFIEKAVFANNLERSGYDREVIMASLSVDKTVISKMISVVKDIPTDVITAIGAARNSGRDRWYQLAIKFRDEMFRDRAGGIIEAPEFISASSDDRLDVLTKWLDVSKPSKDLSSRKPQALVWAAEDRSVSVSLNKTPKRSTISLTEKDNAAFADFIAGQMNSLYEEFRKAHLSSTGD